MKITSPWPANTLNSIGFIGWPENRRTLEALPRRLSRIERFEITVLATAETLACEKYTHAKETH